MLRAGMDSEYAKAVATYLGLTVDKAADFGSTLCILNAEGGRGVAHTFGRQALPMVWDYAESNPFCEQGAGWASYLGRTVDALDGLGFGIGASVLRRDAQVLPSKLLGFVATDPPYYDAINYADLSDFFYVWLKRSIGFLHPNLLALPLTPKREQTVMNVYAGNGSDGRGRKEVARQRYVDGMAKAFQAMAESLEPGGLTGVVFAHTASDAWATLIVGLLGAGLVPEASWPIDTEREGKLSRSEPSPALHLRLDGVPEAGG